MGDGIDGGTGGGQIPAHEVYEALFEENNSRSKTIARVGTFLRGVFRGGVAPGFIESAEASGRFDPDVDLDKYRAFLEEARAAVRTSHVHAETEEI